MITIPWIALVPDISGVCSIVGTFEITSKPTNTVEHEHGQLDDQRLVHVVSLAWSSAARVAACTTSPPRVTVIVADHLVVLVEHELAVLDEQLEELGDVPGVELARVQRHRRGRVREPEDVHAVADRGLARLGQLAVAAGLGGQVDDHRAGAHRLDHRAR